MSHRPDQAAERSIEFKEGTYPCLSRLAAINVWGSGLQSLIINDCSKLLSDLRYLVANPRHCCWSEVVHFHSLRSEGCQQAARRYDFPHVTYSQARDCSFRFKTAYGEICRHPTRVEEAPVFNLQTFSRSASISKLMPMSMEGSIGRLSSTAQFKRASRIMMMMMMMMVITI
jgi:hypothetical protein